MALATESPTPAVAAQDFGSTTTRNLAAASTNGPAVMLLLSAAYLCWYTRTTADDVNPVRESVNDYPHLAHILSRGVTEGSTHYSVALSMPSTFSGGALSNATAYEGVVLTKRTNQFDASEAIASVDFWPFATIAAMTSMTGYVGQIA